MVDNVEEDARPGWEEDGGAIEDGLWGVLLMGPFPAIVSTTTMDVLRFFFLRFFLSLLSRSLLCSGFSCCVVVFLTLLVSTSSVASESDKGRFCERGPLDVAREMFAVTDADDDMLPSTI